MSGLVPIAVLLVVIGKVDVDGLVSVEARGGKAPVMAGQEPELSLVQVLTPDVQLRISDHTFLLRLDYSPRFFWRESNSVTASRPLILHVANLSTTARVSPTVSWTSRASASIGAVDYTFLPQVLGTTQSSLPQTVNFLWGAAGLGAQVSLNPRWTLQPILDASYSRPVGEIAAQQPVTGMTVATVPFPRQTLFRAVPSATFRATRTDDLVFTSTAGYQTISSVGVTAIDPQGGQIPLSGELQILTIAPQIAWRARITPQYELRLMSGVSYNHVFASPSPERPLPIVPIASADLAMHFLKRNDVAVSAMGGFVVDHFVDPVLGATGPRGLTFANVHVAFPPDWIVGAEASFATSLSAEPLNGFLAPTAAVITYPDETTASVALPIRHRVSKNLTMEFGARWSDRGPHLAAPNFSFHQRQVWLYVTLTAFTVPITRWRTP